ncbi:7125_t:CDS:2 [Ambispora gerdemannii]|uniref:7125_t:CDS:1 n=1 Tax=Ambispora gerdemannii TaxID=144530 RepID=A0A9N9BRF5_9GLOM|nr:7125_t:CDS:2 [Ambispora gerdemannii]
MELEQRANILKKISFHLLNLSSSFEVSPNANQIDLPFRQNLFVRYGYNSKLFTNQSHFIDLFREHLSKKEFSTEVDSIPVLEECQNQENAYLRSALKSQYVEAVNKARNLVTIQCHKHKITVLQHYFLIPSGDKHHIQRILVQIDKSFESLLSENIIGYQNAIRFQFTELLLVQRPVKSPLTATGRFTFETTQILEEYFVEKSARLNKDQKCELSTQTGLTVKQIETWFNNRRSRSPKDPNCDEDTMIFLNKKIDWEEKFSNIEKGIMDSDWKYLDDNTSITHTDTSIKYIIASQVTTSNETRKNITAPYSKSLSPRTKIRLTSNSVNNQNLKVSNYNVSIHKNTMINDATQQMNNEPPIDFAITNNNSVIDTSSIKSSNLKVLHRPNKNAVRAHAQPYGKSPKYANRRLTEETQTNERMEDVTWTPPILSNIIEYSFSNNHNVNENPSTSFTEFLLDNGPLLQDIPFLLDQFSNPCYSNNDDELIYTNLIIDPTSNINIKQTNTFDATQIPCPLPYPKISELSNSSLPLIINQENIYQKTIPEHNLQTQTQDNFQSAELQNLELNNANPNMNSQFYCQQTQLLTIPNVIHDGFINTPLENYIIYQDNITPSLHFYPTSNQ